MDSQSQSGNSQNHSIDDPRLAELLKPIKDLTQNWEVSTYNFVNIPFYTLSIGKSG